MQRVTKKSCYIWNTMTRVGCMAFTTTFAVYSILFTLCTFSPADDMPSQYSISGHYRPASKTPFGWRFACGLISVRFYVLTGYSQIQILLALRQHRRFQTNSRDSCEPVYPSICCSHTQSRYEDAVFIPNTGLFSLESYTCIL